MAKDTLKKITNRAKQLRKSHKGMTWKAAVKRAGAEYRSGKKIGNTSAAVVIKQQRPTSTVPGQRAPGLRVGSSVSGSMYTVRDQLEKQIEQTVAYINAHKGNKKPEMKSAVKRQKKLLVSLRKQLRGQNAMISQMLR